jgi:hypothetical protein
LSSAQKEYLAFGLLGLIPLLYRWGPKTIKSSEKIFQFPTKKVKGVSEKKKMTLSI